MKKQPNTQDEKQQRDQWEKPRSLCAAELETDGEKMYTCADPD